MILFDIDTDSNGELGKLLQCTLESQVGESCYV